MTLSTLDIKQTSRSKQPLKTAIIFLAVSVFCIVFNKIYAVFGHGVSSDSMTFMFLYPLLCGALPFLLIWFAGPQPDTVAFYRFSYNIFNSGIALLTVGSLLNGIFEIAGTSSVYLIVFTVFGWTFLSVGIIVYMVNLFRRHQTAG